MKENNLLKSKKVTNKGITLIALVLTIIVLLILAGVSIAMLIGENGILLQAQKAKVVTEKAETKERIELEVLGSYGINGKIDVATLKSNLAANVLGANIGEETELPLTVTVGDYTFKVKENGIVEEEPTVKDPVNPEPPSGDEILTVAPTTAKVTKNTKYQDAESNNKIAVIPAGFTVVPGCTKIDDGLVISDVANDTEDIGNQFVWIPVDKNNFATEFVRREGKYSENGEEKTQSITNFGEANSTGANTNSSITESDVTQAEAIAMYSSVEANGGFYIGRYEAGTTATSGTGIRGNVVSKKGANLYNDIGWNNDTTNNDITVETGGAVQVARSFASEQGYDITQVHSTLCYSVQWNTALNFIDPGYTGYAKDCSKMGWYSDNYNSTSTGNTETNPNHVTGKDLIYTDNSTLIANKHKNIYDMGGNIWEWTMEAFHTRGRALMGGNYTETGSERPASCRSSNPPSNSNIYLGFRLALYL